MAKVSTQNYSSTVDAYPFASDQLLRCRADYQDGADGAVLTKIWADGADPVIYGANPTLSTQGFSGKKGIRFGYNPHGALKQALPAQFSSERPFTLFAYFEMGDLGDNASRFFFGLSNGANRMVLYSGNTGSNNYWNVVGADGTNDIPTNQIVSSASGVCQGRRTRKAERIFAGLRYDGQVFQGIWNGSLIVKTAGYVAVPRTCGTVANDGYLYFNGAPGLDAYNGNPLLREYLLINRAATAPEIAQYWRSVVSESETIVNCYGDSLVYGQGATTDAALGTANGWPQALNDYGRIMRNWGRPATITKMVQSAILLTAPKVPIGNGENSIAVIAAGANDIILGDLTAEQIYANIVVCVNNAKSIGHGRVFVCTVLRSTSFGGYAKLDALNALIVSGATANRYSVCDVSSAVEFQDPTNATYFSDGLHLKTAGYTRYAELVNAVLP